jgi:hypothetical protein
MVSKILPLVVILLVSGCASKLSITYYSEPSGAALYGDDSVKLGTCPVTLQYTLTVLDRSHGYVYIKGVTAFWVSGVTTSLASFRADLSNGDKQQLTFQRPRNAPGYDTDTAHASELERNPAPAQQESDKRFASFQYALKNSQPFQQRTLNCTSNDYAGTVYTNCY